MEPPDLAPCQKEPVVPAWGTRCRRRSTGLSGNRAPSQESQSLPGVPPLCHCTCCVGAGVTLSVTAMGVGVVFQSLSRVLFETPWGADGGGKMASSGGLCELSPDCPLLEGTRLALCLGSGTVLAHIGTVLMAKVLWPESATSQALFSASDMTVTVLRLSFLRLW